MLLRSHPRNVGAKPCYYATMIDSEDSIQQPAVTRHTHTDLNTIRAVQNYNQKYFKYPGMIQHHYSSTFTFFINYTTSLLLPS